MPVRERFVKTGVSFVAGWIAVVAWATTAQAVPVIPGAAGYGMSTPAGRGGAVYRVTNLKADGAGSLKACIDASGARTCIFEVSGAIVLTADMTIRNGKLTVAGQTAPSPGIMIRGGAFKIHASDVLIQHLRFRVGDSATGPDPANRDALKIEGTDSAPVQNIVIDHNTFSWSVDEIASVWGAHDNITFSNNIFAEPLHDSIHPTDDGTALEKHGYGVLLGSSASGGRVTVVGNLFAHIVERNPLARSRELVFLNNLVYDRSNMDLDLQSTDGRLVKNSIVGNQFLKGPSYTRTNKPLYIRTNGTNPVTVGSKIYLENNYAPDTGSTLAQLLTFTAGDTTPTLILTTGSRPVWNSGLVVLNTAGNAVYDSVLRNAGARPNDRDSADKRVVTEVKARTGQTINCVAANGSSRCSKNAGGWPVYAQNRRALTLPANQATLTSSGYTNLELWLQQMDKSMSGVIAAQSPGTPQALAVR
jgi:pectate lyase